MIAEIASAAPTPTPQPIPPYYDCSVVHKLPFKGMEVLYVMIVFIIIAVCFAITFIDVTVKQWWPSLLDPIVAARIALLQKLLPNLGLSEEEKKCLYNNKNDGEGTEDGDDEDKKSVVPVVKSHYVYAEDGTPIEYDSVVSQAPYVASKSVDDDLLIQLANNDIFETISAYCSGTSRGYSMLSVALPCCIMMLAMVWMHNVIVDPKAADFYGILAFCGYFFGFFTAVVMCGPPSCVHRNANIMLFMNYPLYGPGAKVGDLHGIGIGVFAAVPTVCHLIQALTWGKDKMPNYETQLSIIILELGSGIMMAISKELPKWCPGKVTKDQAKRVSIMGETLVLFLGMIGFLFWEAEATMICAGKVEVFRALLLGAFLLPFLTITRHLCWAPTEFGGLPPSVALMRNGEIVGLFGPCSAEEYYASNCNYEKGTSSKLAPRIKLTAA